MTKRRLSTIIIVCLLSVGVCVSPVTASWTSSKHKNATAQIKNLNLARQKSVAAHIVKMVVKDPFFTKAELPHLVTMAKLDVKGPAIGISDIDFTNLVVNLFLKEPQIDLVNQEVKLDMSMDFSLMHYVKGLELRKKGILLGANYYIDGDLLSSVVTLPSGKVTQTYTATLVVRDIHTDQTIIQKQYTYQRKSGQKKAFRKDQ